MKILHQFCVLVKRKLKVQHDKEEREQCTTLYFPRISGDKMTTFLNELRFMFLGDHQQTEEGHSHSDLGTCKTRMLETEQMLLDLNYLQRLQKVISCRKREREWRISGLQ